MRTDDFDFDLPQENIALRPAKPREAARLLVVDPAQKEAVRDHGVRDLPMLLRPGDALVLNNTRVIPARLTGRRIGRGVGEPKIEVTLHRQTDPGRWLAFARPARKLEPGDHLHFGADNDSCGMGRLDAVVEKKGNGGEVSLRFELDPSVLSQTLDMVGAMPLPPYIASRRPPDMADATDYQTVFAETSGAVAAPTAGLHFSPMLFAALEARGVSSHFLTLHVGAGTFLPVRTDDISEHQMHAEWGEISAETAAQLNEVRAGGGRIVAVGTTSLRLLETAADETRQIMAFKGDTDIFITPGYRFRAIDLLLTNFHLPRSTLFMLVAAFSGLDVMKQAYAQAIQQGYRFYSYGDACLLHPHTSNSELKPV